MITSNAPVLSPPVDEMAAALRRGAIVALKGAGGFHLLCDARNAIAVARLRERKACDGTPLAVMMPSVEAAQRYCHIGWQEEAALRSPEAPIVLLRPRTSDLAANVTGSAPLVGALLPCSVLHHRLLQAFGSPIVATSGNSAGDPIAIDEGDARRRLGAIADLVVSHDPPVSAGCDDSIVRVSTTGTSLLRRGRGLAPLAIDVGGDMPAVLAVGGHHKNTIAIGRGRLAMVSPHLGDLETASARRAFGQAITDLCHVHRFTPEFVVADRHPGYASRQWAESAGLPILTVQHHHAHVAACAAEHGVSPPYLGVAWDEGGLGERGEIWGGEFFAVTTGGFERVAHLRPFRLLGGDTARHEGWRVAVAMDWAMRGQEALDARADGSVLEVMLRRGINAPASTTLGRLFDALAAITGLRACSRLDGESSLALETAIDPHERGSYPFGAGLIGDWAPLLAAVRTDLTRRTPVGVIAARFHWTLVEWICRVVDRLEIGTVVLSGCLFENAFLLDHTVRALTSLGHRVYTPRRVPANDGGLSLGQLALARGLGIA